MLQMSCFRGCSRAGNLNPNLFGTKSLAGRGGFRRRINSQRNITAAVAEAQRRSLGSQLERLQRNCFKGAASEELLQKSCCSAGVASEELLQGAVSEEPLEKSCSRGAALQARESHRPNRAFRAAESKQGAPPSGGWSRKIPFLVLKKTDRGPENDTSRSRKRQPMVQKKTTRGPEKNRASPSFYSVHLIWKSN